ncbi:MAG: hypothetical protein ABJO09_01090 [Hyphomicrobiales bacterium]
MVLGIFIFGLVIPGVVIGLLLWKRHSAFHGDVGFRPSENHSDSGWSWGSDGDGGGCDGGGD